ncbi:MAG: alpha/beta hydrolase [Acidobacteria bacterium]|nr:alpha/beta hydrolase [Acidobacteriota bacterium]MDA1234757.1 alpha/beta hydrolase [Acidobacteriota bacterium]
MRHALVLFSALLVTAPLLAQRGGAPPERVRLWAGDAPGAMGQQDEDIPTLDLYLVPPERAVGTAVVVCPGGGYRALAIDHEGEQIARWWNSLGVSAFVLKYRLGPKYHHPVELGDAQRALRWVRSRAGQYGFQSDRIGIMGFSAGGHLASSAATLFDKGQAAAEDPLDRLSSRPDFAVLAYPVISMTTEYVHQGSKRKLLGDNPDPALAAHLSTELQVTPETPPVFLFHTNEDTAVPAENSILFYLALRRAKIPAELHIYERGPHGVGLAWSDAVLSSWPSRLADWMRISGLLASR